jgi:hypothetical protein
MLKAAVVSLLLALPVSAGAQSIHVIWGYTPPTSPAVSGFRLYQEGVPVCSTAVPSAQEMDCDVVLIKKITVYTLTALFADDTESPHSAPYAFDMDDRLLAPWAFGGNRMND